METRQGRGWWKRSRTGQRCGGNAAEQGLVETHQGRTEVWWKHTRAGQRCGGNTPGQDRGVVETHQGRTEVWWKRSRTGQKCGGNKQGVTEARLNTAARGGGPVPSGTDPPPARVCQQLNSTDSSFISVDHPGVLVVRPPSSRAPTSRSNPALPMELFFPGRFTPMT